LTPRITLDQLRAFLGLADCLNLSMVARQFELTRQTVRRHVDELEHIQGRRLFRLANKQYSLTAAGKALYPEIKAIVEAVERLSDCDGIRLRRIEGMEHARYRAPDGQVFFSQQYPPSTLMETGLPLLRAVLHAWGASVGHVKHDRMRELRPYVVIYRRTKTGWLFAEVGEKSGYARWFGVDFALSAMGMPFEEDGVGEEYNNFISRAYNEVHENGGVRLDHVHAQLLHPGEKRIKTLNFQRLLAGVSLGNGKRALLMASALTNKIQIDALAGQAVPQMGDDLVMEGFADV
jgi:biotin operon repressor